MSQICETCKEVFEDKDLCIEERPNCELLCMDCWEKIEEDYENMVKCEVCDQWKEEPHDFRLLDADCPAIICDTCSRKHEEENKLQKEFA